jgi:P27 family predicted phage terminase small subunit
MILPGPGPHGSAHRCEILTPGVWSFYAPEAHEYAEIGGGRMPAGRPPVPAERKRKLGNPGARPLPDAGSVHAVQPVTQSAPAQLGSAGAEMFRRIVDGAAWLAETDKPTLELLCEKVDRREAMKAQLSRSELVLFTDKMYAYPNPLVGMLSTIETEIAKLFSALGLTPTDRTRMGLAEVKARNAFEDFLAKKAGV